MSAAQRVRCAAADLWGDKHQAVGRWYQVIDPCSGACLVEYATLGALPVDIANPGQPCHTVPPAEGEAAA
jgi:hypothetical protein